MILPKEYYLIIQETYKWSTIDYWLPQVVAEKFYGSSIQL